jgi:hypothetical protein
MRFIYEAHQIQPSNYFFDLTSACGTADYHIGNSTPSTGNAYVVVLSGRELDLSKKLLFSMSFTAKSLLNDKERNDTVGMMEVVRFDLLDDSGIDTVIIQNGWIKYVAEPPPPIRRKSVSLTSDAVTIQSDSSFWMPLNISEVDSAAIKNAVFTFTVDSNSLWIDTVEAGAMLPSSTTVTFERKTPRINVYISDIDTSRIMQGSGELLRIKVSTLPRTDTVCTEYFDSAFIALNTDNLLDTVSYSLGSICIEGVPVSDTDTTTSSVKGWDKNGSTIQLHPNPANSTVTFLSNDSQPFTVEIIAPTGMQLFTQSTNNGVMICDIHTLSTGVYRVRIRTKDGTIETRSLLVIR